MKLIVGFDSGSSTLHIVPGNGDRDRDMLSFLEEVDRGTPPGVMIELIEDPLSAKLTPSVCKFLFSKVGRFSLVINRPSNKLIRMRNLSDSLLQRNHPFCGFRAKSRSELVWQIVDDARSFRMPQMALDACVRQ